ncbi:U-box domain-containing protein 35 [Cucumis melo]|uniref:U-box domain-containing protein 35 n=1 Tax=Cucumis melo TaxID=3656 RepID=A0A1S3B2D7_CUCME|nr:U-box domain-containing protein 35 [Cucumis melo]
MSALPSSAEARHFSSDEGLQTEFSNYRYSSSISEIEEENSAETLDIKGTNVSLLATTALESIREDYSGGCSFSSDALKWEDCVYVGIGKNDSSVDALQWTLKNAITTSTTVVYLLHVFPEIRYIPSPLGKIPINQVSKEQVAIHVAQEESKRKDFLQNFLDSCSAAKVKADTVLIESDMVAKAILDVIPILNIRKLVLGVNKSRKLRSRGGSGIANEILQKAPEYCEVKVVCEGKEMNQLGRLPSPLSSPRYQDDSFHPNSSITEVEQQRNNSISCMCFKTRFV